MSDEPNEGVPRWGMLGWGIAFFAIAFYLHGVFTDLETHGGSIRINVVIGALYKWLGKWAVVGAAALLGAGFCWRAFVPGESDD